MATRKPRNTAVAKATDETPEQDQVVTEPAAEETPDALDVDQLAIPDEPEAEPDAPAEPPALPTVDEQPADETAPVDRSGWVHEQQVNLHLPQKARPAYATRLLEAADHLGYPRAAVHSQSGGYRVPLGLHQYLFPSEYGDDTQE
jgi:hypothetical protein